MTEPTPLRFRCDECDWVGEESQIFKAANPFDTSRTIHGCPECQSVDQFTNVCDEPGCTREAGCGWPTPDGGYRRTCGEHWKWIPVAQPAKVR